ncbi:hypothetical protein ETU10_00055 [Apibacter muscae]|uniref:hypothetical protein n=1 Tax=Apibacter muscae TaxID=2509004 RepID=UPI0011AC5E76|nr:hypothetical protein [Apibacter muscae]TWP25432.1 hypothetical protein ETU10_00055 [Apibacter muscae]
MEKELKFTDEKTQDIIVVHFSSWLSIIKGILIKYANKTEVEAEKIISDKKSGIFKAPYSYSSTALVSHELEYHWAMLGAYGEMYWLPENGGISSQEPEDYFDWYDSYIKENNLKEPFIFIDKKE